MNVSSESGFMTIDFMFALTIALGFATILFAVSFTLSMVEVGQYVTFAASRAYNGAHANENFQRDIATAKFNELVKKPVLSRILASGWVTFKNIELADHSAEYNDPDNNVYVGAKMEFEARVLNIRIPMLGSTAENSSTGKATLNSYLLREPSDEECRENFNKLRYEKLKELYSGVPESTAVLVTDNGC